MGEFQSLTQSLSQSMSSEVEMQSEIIGGENNDLTKSHSNANIPSKEDVLFCAEVCYVMSTFSKAEKFSMLPINDNTTDIESTSGTVFNLSSFSFSQSNCTGNLVLEALFTNEYKYKTWIEMCIFQSSDLNQIVACYKGPDELQDKPLKRRRVKMFPFKT